MTRLVGKFVWFEHLSNDVATARDFYSSLFGWDVQTMAMGGIEYPLIQCQGEGIGGFREAPATTPNHWTSYLSVADLDAAYVAVQAAGGTGLMPPVAFGPMGHGAAVADPTGAVFWLWHGAMGDPEDRPQIPMHTWYWSELITPETDVAAAFYERAFGYTSEAMDMGPFGTYTVLSQGDKARAGIMKPEQPGLPAIWLPYVRVADCDATITQAAGLDAQCLHGPVDIPQVGRLAVLLDPVGAVIAVIAVIQPVGR